MKNRIGIIAVMALLVSVLSACVYHQSNAKDMVDDMIKIREEKKSIVSILWYNGSDSNFDYFGYVYSMTGTTRYKVPLGQLVMNERFYLTDDDTKWVQIREIKGVWSASRLDISKGVWQEDKEGISIRLNVK